MKTIDNLFDAAVCKFGSKGNPLGSAIMYVAIKFNKGIIIFSKEVQYNAETNSTETSEVSDEKSIGGLELYAKEKELDLFRIPDIKITGKDPVFLSFIANFNNYKFLKRLAGEDLNSCIDGYIQHCGPEYADF